MIAPLVLALLALAPRPAAPAFVPTPDPRPTVPAMRIHLPVLVILPIKPNTTRVPAPRPTAARMALRPTNSAGLRLALLVPGALVEPAPGEYRDHGQFRVAAGVTVDGRGAVQLLGFGLRLDRAEGAVIRGVTISGSTTDAIEILHTRTATVELVNLSDTGDGLLDVIRVAGPGGLILVRDSILHDDDKCSLLGHFDPAGDEQLRVRFERVQFIRCGARTPKVHRARVELVDTLIADWRSRAVDVQLGGHVSLKRTRFEAGRQSGARIRLESGGTIAESGTQYVPWAGAE